MQNRQAGDRKQRFYRQVALIKNACYNPTVGQSFLSLAVTLCALSVRSSNPSELRAMITEIAV